MRHRARILHHRIPGDRLSAGYADLHLALGQRIRSDGEMHVARLAGLQMNALETALSYITASTCDTPATGCPPPTLIFTLPLGSASAATVNCTSRVSPGFR
jgi:hypothetical protein